MYADLNKKYLAAAAAGVTALVVLMSGCTSTTTVTPTASPTKVVPTKKAVPTGMPTNKPGPVITAPGYDAPPSTPTYNYSASEVVARNLAAAGNDFQTAIVTNDYALLADVAARMSTWGAQGLRAHSGNSAFDSEWKAAMKATVACGDAILNGDYASANTWMSSMETHLTLATAAK
jgi:hypothetical protein